MAKPFQITDEILGKLVAIAKASGIDLGIAPDGSDIGDLKPVIPAVYLKRAVSEIAHETGLNLKDSGLYIYANRLVTVEADGSTLDMDYDRFRSWIDKFQLNYNGRGRSKSDDEAPGPPIRATMKADVAKVLLRSDEFLGHLPVIKRILPVRLPVWTQDGEGHRGVKLLPYGYDQESGVFTRNTGVEYLEFWTLEAAVQYLRDLLRDFPYGDEGRSLAVQLAAMMTTYCQLLFADRDRWPLIYFNANQPGSGKSRLAELCIYPVWGTADALTYSDNDEFVKKLDTWAQKGVAYTFLDDVSGLVKNNDLNRWLTSPTWAGRIMHKQQTFSVLNQTLTLLTGNQATLSDDLTRRSLMVDLWSSELPGDRQSRLSQVIDAEWLAQAKNRSDVLSALFALVKHWSEKGAPSNEKLIPSFEGWSRIVPAIVKEAGFDCPLTAPNVQDAGGKQEVEFLRLLEAAVRDTQPRFGKPVDILLTDWCRLARSVGVFHSVISDTSTMREVLDGNSRLYKSLGRDPQGNALELTDSDRNAQASRYMDKSQSTKFGNLLNKFYRGQIRKIYGRRYKFADREARHSTFSLELLDDEPPPPDLTDAIAAALDAAADDPGMAAGDDADEDKCPF